MRRKCTLKALRINILHGKLGAEYAEIARKRVLSQKVVREGGMRAELRERKLKGMEEAMMGLRLAQRGGSKVKGWLREVRQATGVTVNEAARRIGVSRCDVYRMEESEMESRIMLATLRRAAEGLGCDLVYGLAPREGTLGEMAAREKAARDSIVKERREARIQQRREERQPWLKEIGWRRAMLNGLRAALQREGVRVRPRKTDAGLAAKEQLLKELGKLAGLPVSAADLEWIRERRSREEGGGTEGLRD